MDREMAERWEIDQDEFGNPLVRHRHSTLTVGAFVLKDSQDRRVARCPSCGDEVEIPGESRDSP
jgi:hypothetical protein